MLRCLEYQIVKNNMNIKDRFSFWYELLLIIYTLFPVLFLILFLSYILRARLYLGYWPTPYHPDPKSMNFYFHHWALFISIVTTPFAGLAWLLQYIFRNLLLNRAKYLLFIYPIPWIIYILILKFDPFRFIEWFLD